MELHKTRWMILVFSIIFLSSCTLYDRDNDGVVTEEVISTIEQDSIHYEYHENGELRSKAPYFRGEIHGEYESYWSNGNMYGRVTYDNGVRKGFYENFDSTSQNILKRVEYIDVPQEIKEYFQADYVNRIWDYIGGDTNTISTASTIYKMKLNDEGDGVKMLFNFSEQNSEDGVFNYFTIITGEDGKDSRTINSTDHKQIFNYVYSKEDLKNGFVRGFISAVDFYEKDGVKRNTGRELYFWWNIKESKLENHLIGN
jgi:antitoxin component YwqK of YwqJK toxin-antitoxin module